MLQIEIDQLKEENARLKKLLPLHNLFKRVPKKSGRGGHYQVSDEMNNIALRSMSYGCVSAEGLEVVCRIIAEEFPVLMEPLTEEKCKFEIPTGMHFCRIRNDLDYITSKQTDEFVEAASTLYLTSDDTSTCREGKSLLGTGLINENGEFHSFKNKLVLGGTAEDKERHVMEILTPAVIEKFGGIVADTLYAQANASHRILANIKAMTGRDDLPDDQLNCMLHHGGNGYKYMIREIKTDDNKSLLVEMDHHLEITCSSRIGTGLHKQSIRQDLEAKLKSRGLRKTGVFFKGRLGSRYGVEYHNSVACVVYKDILLECILEHIEHLNALELKKPKSKQIPLELRQNTRFHKMRDIIQNQWTQLTMQFSLAILCYNVMIEPMKEIDSIKTPVRRLKELIQLEEERFQVIFDCSENHFERLRRMNIRAECTPIVKEVLEHCEQQWHLATAQEKLQLDRMTLKAFQGAYVKFKKDTKIITEMEDSDKILPVSNKRQESYFSHYKLNEKLYLHMTDGMLEIVSKAKLNKVILSSHFFSNVI